jgi:hypothetical protein
MTRRSSSKVAPKLVNQVVDTLYVRVSRNAQPSQWLAEVHKQVIEYRQKFESDPNLEPLIIQHPELGAFTLFARSSRPYDFALINPKIAEIKIYNPEKWSQAVYGQTGQFYVLFRSEFLQFKGTDAACEYLETLEKVMCSPEPLEGLSAAANESLNFYRVSRIDLTCDTQEARGMKWSDLDLYTCRSKKRDAFKVPPLEDVLAKMLEDTRRGKAPPRNNKGGGKGMTLRADAVPNDSKPFFDSSLTPHINALAKARGHDPEELTWLLGQTLKGVGFDPDCGYISRIVSNGSSQLQTVYFGRFSSEVYAKRYDKLASLAVQQKEFMRDVWLQNGWDGESPVLRTEFTLTGDFLRAVMLEGAVLDLRDLGLCLTAIPRLWQYLTTEWLVHHAGEANDVTHDAIKKRPTSKLWEIVQSAHLAGDAGMTRAKREPKPILEQLKAQADGLITTMLAMTDSPRFKRSLDPVTGEIFDPVVSVIKDIAVKFGSDDGKAKVAARQARLGLDFISDTVLSALARKDMMALGRGS